MLKSVQKILYQDGEVSADEFMKAIEANCERKSFAEFPPAFKAFITGVFKAIDVDGTWLC